MDRTTAEDLVEVGTPIDLDNCAREPIHIPGLIQPRGVLIAMTEPDLVITQVSANLPDVLGVAVDAALGRPISAAVGATAAAVIARAASAFGDLRDRNPHDVRLLVDGAEEPFDAILHRVQGILVVELEAAFGPRPFSFPNTYQAVRGSVGELNRAATLVELFDITARAVRDLTGFDRVMVYRYDHEYNGEVVAENKRADLHSFLGQHYPASDIPAQARALYEKNWIRLISDIEYTPVPIVPTLEPGTGAPLDLTHASLRSVSPIHVEYLQNMGVHASMSISLLRDGALWGLIACHHYAGPHTPPYGVRAAAEFLGSTLSLRLVDRYEDDDLRDRLTSQGVLTRLTGALADTESVADALLGEPNLLHLVPATGAAVLLRDRFAQVGRSPGERVARALAAWAVATEHYLVATDSIARDVPGLDVPPELASGAMVVTLPDGQFLLWTRAETEQTIEWAGDPHNKAIAVQEGDSVRLSPRRSFERWREVVRCRSLPWTNFQRDIATELRRNVVESLYARARSEVRMAETLQRSLLPPIPVLARWSLSANYEPAAGGRIGGDWYDAFELRDGGLAIVLGDVVGHGIGAAGTMAQLRNVLRAYLFEGAAPEDALQRLNQYMADLVPGAYATVAVGVVDQNTGRGTVASAGHPAPFVVHVDGSVAPLEIETSPPLGVLDARFRASTLVLAAGDGLVLFSDGLVERRDEDLDVGLDRLAGVLRGLGADATAERIHVKIARLSPAMPDDATVVAVHRPA